MSEALKSVAIHPVPDIRFLMVALARLLKARHGSRIHLYCTSRDQVRFYEGINGDGLFDSVNDAGLHLREAWRTAPDEARETAAARTRERRYGTTFNRLALANRHFGRGYALAGFYHPRSRLAERASYAQMLHAYNETLAFWEREIAQKDLSLVLNGPLEVGSAAAAHGLPYRALIGSRYKNYHYWAHDPHFGNPAVAEAYRRAEVDPGELARLTEPYMLELTHRKCFQARTSLSGLLRELGYKTAQRGWWLLRGYDKAKGYYLTEELRFLLRRWRDTRRMTGAAMLPLAAIKDSAYVFFPLHTEPEASVGQASPEYFYQHAAIAALSRDLPAGVRLAVKETIHGVGRRPANFYDQIAELKNVVWLDMMEFGLEVVRHARAVATITGSAGFEAAVLGKPVIAFGRHNLYGVLPHVHVVTDEARLVGILGAVLGDEDMGAVRRRLDGARYLKAVVETSFDLGGYDFVNVARVDEGAVHAAYEGLLASLEPAGAARAAR